MSLVAPTATKLMDIILNYPTQKFSMMCYQIVTSEINFVSIVIRETSCHAILPELFFLRNGFHAAVVHLFGFLVLFIKR